MAQSAFLIENIKKERSRVWLVFFYFDLYKNKST